MLEPIASASTLFIDTSRTDHLSICVTRSGCGYWATQHQELALLAMHLAFKHGVPSDSDLVFDVRFACPNPYWDPALRIYKGTDAPSFNSWEAHPGNPEND